MAANDFEDVINLTVVSVACLYVICYLSRKIEGNHLGKALSKVGKDSFYIMGLHFIGFKFFTLMINAFGGHQVLAELVPGVGHNVGLLFGYILFGAGVPLVIMYMIRRLKRMLGLC